MILRFADRFEKVYVNDPDDSLRSLILTNAFSVMDYGQVFKFFGHSRGLIAGWLEYNRARATNEIQDYITRGWDGRGNAFYLPDDNDELRRQQIVVDVRPVVANTALVVGDDAVKLAVRLHMQADEAYVEGRNRSWLANIIAKGLEAGGVFRPDQGWSEVKELLRQTDSIALVASNGQLPAPSARSLRGRLPGLAPHNWRTSRYGNGYTMWRLAEIAYTIEGPFA